MCRQVRSDDIVTVRVRVVLPVPLSRPLLGVQVKAFTHQDFSATSTNCAQSHGSMYLYEASC